MMEALAGSRGDQMAQIVYRVVILNILLKKKKSIAFNSSNTTEIQQNEFVTLESHKNVFEASFFPVMLKRCSDGKNRKKKKRQNLWITYTRL